MPDWIQWHTKYEDPSSQLARRLVVVRTRIADALDHFPAGKIRVASMCAGDGRDLLGVLEDHPRARDVHGRLVELNPQLAERVRASAPAGIEVVCGDAGISNSYEGAVPVDLLLCCGRLGNISEEDIHRTIESWPLFCAPHAIVIWTRGHSEPDLRNPIRRWVQEAGFKELSFDGMDDEFGVGVAQMTCDAKPYQRGIHLFTFIRE